MKKTISLLLALVLCLSLCACGNSDAYNNANASLSQGRYEEAAKLYVEAGNYKDSKQKLLEIYYHAVNCYESKEYDEAYSLFVILNDASINDSAQYLALLEANICFEEALENARHAFEEQDIFSGFEWLEKASTYATEEQQVEIAQLKWEISYLVYVDTQFITFDAFLSKKAAQPQTLDGKYSYYSYYLSGHNYDDIHTNFKVHYDNNYTEIGYADIPKWIFSTIQQDYCFAYCDASGNIIVWNFAKHYSNGNYTTMDVYVFYADYVESMS